MDNPSPPSPPPAPDATVTLVRRGPGKPFLPGNPGGGRPRTSATWRNLVKRGAEQGGKVLLALMQDTNTPKETRRKIAEFFIERKYGRAVTTLAGADGEPLFPTGPAIDGPLSALLARLVARRSGATTPEAPASPGQENAPQIANGEAPGPVS